MSETDITKTKPTILVVDDTPENLSLLIEELSATGHSVRPANNGAAALKLAERITPDLIILDIRMPEMDGYEVCSMLKANPATSDIPVIFLSALEDTFDIVKAFEVGGVDYVQKPFIKEELLARIETHLSLRALRLDLESQVEQRTEELQQSEEKFRGMVMNLMEGFYRATLDGMLLDYNPEFSNITGLDPNINHVGYPLPDFWQDPNERGDYLDALIKDGFIEDYIVKAKRLNGEHIITRLNSRLIKDEDGQPLRIEGTVLDITHRRQQEEILSTRLRLLETSATHSIDELLQAFLDEAEKLTGSEIGFFHFLEEDQNTLSLQAWSTNTLETMCTAEGQDTHYPVDEAGVWVDCIKERRPVIHNDYASLPHKKGMPEGHTPVIREMVIPVLRGDKIVAVLGVGNKSRDYQKSDVNSVATLADLAWDIVERKQAEEELLLLNKELEDRVRQRTSEIEAANAALIESESRLDLALSTAKAGTWTLNVQDNTSWWDENVRQIFGYQGEPSDNYVDHWRSVVHPDDRQEAQDAFNRAFDNPELARTSIEYRVQLDSGDKYILDQLFIDRDEEGQAVRTIGLTQDISEIKVSETLLVEQQMKLATIEERQRLAHDLHDSVTQSLYSLTLLAETGRRAADADNLESVSHYVGRLGKVAQQALKEMRLMIYELRPEALEQNGLVGALRQRLEAVEGRVGVKTEIHDDISVELPPAIEDALFNVASEALNNAIKHASATEIKITLSETDREIYVEIGDNGRGFSVEEKINSGGLGLMTMRDRAEKLNGKFEIDSKINEGTIAQVIIPL